MLSSGENRTESLFYLLHCSLCQYSSLRSKSYVLLPEIPVPLTSAFEGSFKIFFANRICSLMLKELSSIIISSGADREDKKWQEDR